MELNETGLSEKMLLGYPRNEKWLAWLPEE
jgi:hypothetical protein